MKNSRSNFLRRRQRVNKHSREACAAGVLPLSWDDSGKRVALLGYGACSQAGSYRHFWSDFGGKLDPEESSINAAMREFHEETAYFFQPHVQQSRQLLRLHGNEKYVSFVTEVPHADAEFIRKNAEHVKAEGNFYERNHVEMDDYRWVPLSLLLQHPKELLSAGLYPPFVEYHLAQPSVKRFLELLLKESVETVKNKTLDYDLLQTSMSI